MKLSIITKAIGKRGCLGVILFAIGLFTFVGARSGAENLYQNTDEVNYAESLSKEAGYNSYTDYLIAKEQKSGGFFMLIGAGLTVWGFKRYNGKRPDVEAKQTDKSAA